MLGAAGPLVGREAELTTALAVLGPDGPPVLQVAGPPGIGKSRLLRELADHARGGGHLVLHGRAAEFEAEVPFGLLRTACEDWLDDLGPDERRALADRDAVELAQVLPAFEAPGDGRLPATGEERHRAFRAVRRLLERAGAQRPVLLVLDDVHWADPASQELLAHLLLRVPRGAVRLALGLRPAQLPALLERSLAGAVREHDAVRLDLRPLDAAASRRLVQDAVPPDVADALHRESGGTPFFLLALARAYAEEGRRPMDADADEPGSVPAAVRTALTGELAALAPRALELLRGAAVAGDPFEPRVAARAADVADADVPDLLDALTASGLVQPGPAGRVAFRHPIVRATVLDGAGGGWLAQAHGRVAAHLAATGADVAARAPHVERSAVPGDPGAVAVLHQAGDAAMARAPALAARWYAAAAGVLPDTPDAAPTRVELRLAEATAATAAGHLERGHRALGAVLELLGPDAPDRTPVVAACAGLEHLLGRHRDAHARLTAAHAAVPDPDGAGAALLEVELAAAAGYETRPQEMLDRARAAFARAERLELRPLAAVAAGQVALAHYFLGLPAERQLEAAAQRFAGLSDLDLATRLDLGLWLGWTEAVLEHHERSLRTCERVLRVARETRQGAPVLVTRTAATWSLLRLGRLDEADAQLASAVQTGRLAPNLYFSVSLGQLALLRLAQGRLPEALRAGEESRETAAGADPGLIPGMSGLYAAVALLEAGRPAAAHAAVLDMSGGDRELRTSRSGHVHAYEVLTRAALDLGAHDAAGEWAQRAAAASHGGHLPAEDAHAQRAQAELELAQGDAATAADRALAAALRGEQASLPIDAGRCEVLAGRALAAAGRREDAVAVLDRAADRLVAVGAHGWAAGAERELRRLGRRRAARFQAATGLDALTERERQVAELVHAGHSNRQIAERIFVSEKTVERTLTGVFTKLGVANRTALATLVEAEHRPSPLGR
ncbi:LuxR family transcriptional regulator [Conexibacter sp. SYSU D00693]|uniref:helix-turn-helix transcriptional regulator n=1 Tax=Conexibacter sp. SYSU D00693 TaxID=2812560 RepID=UPI00196A303D|nr:LuxR family transcriptional regulator [Conexibacter sp. SYSU D00693]